MKYTPRFTALMLGALLLLPLALTATRAEAKDHHHRDHKRHYTTQNTHQRYNNGGLFSNGRYGNNTRKEDKQRRTYEKFVAKRERAIRKQSRHH